MNQKIAILSVESDFRGNPDIVNHIPKLGFITISTVTEVFVITTHELIGVAEEMPVNEFNVIYNNIQEKLRNLIIADVYLRAVPNAIDAIREAFSIIHTLQVDKVVIWNMAYDVKLILKTCKLAGLSAAEVIYPKEPNKVFNYYEDDFKNYIDGIEIIINQADRKRALYTSGNIEYINGIYTVRRALGLENSGNHSLKKITAEYLDFKNPIEVQEMKNVTGIAWYRTMLSNHLPEYLARCVCQERTLFDLNEKFNMFNNKQQPKEEKPMIKDTSPPIHSYIKRMSDLITEAASKGIVFSFYPVEVIYPEKPKDVKQFYPTSMEIGLPNEIRHPYFDTINRVKASAIMVKREGESFYNPFVPEHLPQKVESCGDPEAVTIHEVAGDDSPVKLFAINGRNEAGAHNHYALTKLTLRDGQDNEAVPYPVQYIDFQEGNPLTQGYNGWTIEHLLAVAHHRLSGYQAGKFACEENQNALEHIELAIRHLNKRTVDRIARQVKNTDKQ